MAYPVRMEGSRTTWLAAIRRVAFTMDSLTAALIVMLVALVTVITLFVAGVVLFVYSLMKAASASDDKAGRPRG